MVDTHVTPMTVEQCGPHTGPGAYRLGPGEYQERMRIETTRSDGEPVITDPAEIAEHRVQRTRGKAAMYRAE